MYSNEARFYLTQPALLTPTEDAKLNPTRIVHQKLGMLNVLANDSMFSDICPRALDNSPWTQSNSSSRTQKRGIFKPALVARFLLASSSECSSSESDISKSSSLNSGMDWAEAPLILANWEAHLIEFGRDTSLLCTI